MWPRRTAILEHDPWRRVQSASFGTGVGGLVLGLLASLDVRLLPPWPAAWLPVVHLAAAAVSGIAGWGAQRRLEAIDRERWHWATEDGATSDERKLAHEEAERRRRSAGLAFCLGPVGLAYWLANQTAGAASGFGPGLIPLTALAALALGFLLARIVHGAPVPPA
ncbi:MAG: hypothetical protein ACRD2Z_15910 [Thermoanaerobaculia bacterium]